jgi:hypothetical protein
MHQRKQENREGRNNTMKDPPFSILLLIFEYDRSGKVNVAT